MRPRDDRETEVRKALAYALEDRLAPYYERHLVEECGYRTPDVLVGALAESGAADPSPVSSQRGAPRWLDMGAGTGLVGKAALRGGLGIELVALDLSPAMLALIDCPLYVDRLCADAAGALPFADAQFDGVMAAGLLEHVLDPEALFRNAARVVRTGGAFAFTFPPNDRGRIELLDTDQGLVAHDPTAIRGCLASAGLQVTRELDYPAYSIGSKGWVTHHLVLGLAGVRGSE